MILRSAVGALAIAALLALAGCGGGDEDAEPPVTAEPPATQPEPTPPATEPPPPPETEPEPSETETEPAETITLLVYFLRGEKVGVVHREVAETVAVGRAAMEELLAGPTGEEEAAGLGTTIPTGTRLLDLAIADGVATVDLSGEFDDGGGSLSMFARLAQVVHTLTQFPTVDGVVFRLDGEPVEVFSSEGIGLEGPQTREGYEDLAPAILVEWPAPGDVVSSPLRLAGTSNTFEATLNYELVDAAGTVLAEGFGTATCGTGCRGEFELEIPFDPGGAPRGTLNVFEISAKDGTRINVVEIPLEFASG